MKRRFVNLYKAASPWQPFRPNPRYHLLSCSLSFSFLSPFFFFTTHRNGRIAANGFIFITRKYLLFIINSIRFGTTWHRAGNFFRADNSMQESLSYLQLQAYIQRFFFFFFNFFIFFLFFFFSIFSRICKGISNIRVESDRTERTHGVQFYDCFKGKVYLCMYVSVCKVYVIGQA